MPQEDTSSTTGTTVLGSGESNSALPRILTPTPQIGSLGRHGLIPRRADDVPVGPFAPTGRFGRMFPGLAPLKVDPSALRELAMAMNEEQIIDGQTKTFGGDNRDIPAGFTYLGQFIDHDLTFDPTSIEDKKADPSALKNFRTPKLDLDCLYGSGPSDQPFLYDRRDPALFLIGKTNATRGGGDNTIKPSLEFDLPRSPQGFALIGDPRNDENLVVAQLHQAFLKFHNKLVVELRKGTIPRESPLRKSDFEEARDLAIWHYQWIVLHDFLGRLLDKSVLKDVLENGPRYLRFDECCKTVFMPVEFSVAAYRFGHTMVREEYDYNRVFRVGGVVPASLSLLFRFTGLSTEVPDVSTVAPIPSDWIIDWRRFFDIPNAQGIKANPSRTLDPYLVPQLHRLPNSTPGDLDLSKDPALAFRNLARGVDRQLPPGQSIARLLGIKGSDLLTPAEIANPLFGPDGPIAAKHGLHIESPLWYYILKEAQVQGRSKRLGKVGSRIIAETFVALLLADNSSFLARKPEWTPRILPATKKDEFTMADLLNFVADDADPIAFLSPVDDPKNIG